MKWYWKRKMGGNHRNGPARDGTATPQWLFDLLNGQVRDLCGQSFVLDAAAEDWNAKCKHYYDEQTDALKQDWSKWPTIWCNPPFSASLIERFVLKALEAAERGSTVVLLLPMWPGYDWYQSLKQKGQMQDIIGPVRFKDGNGKPVVLNNGRWSTSIVIATLIGRSQTDCQTARVNRRDPATEQREGWPDAPVALGLRGMGFENVA